jgi:hypothetical protein
VHIDNDASDTSGPLLAEPAEEFPQDCSISATTDPYDAALEYVRDQRQVAMPLLLGYFVDSQENNSVEVSLAQQTTDVSDFGILDHPPIHVGKLRYSFDGHFFGQPKKPMLESAGTTSVRSGNPQDSWRYATLGTEYLISTKCQDNLVLADAEVPQTHPSLAVVGIQSVPTSSAAPNLTTLLQPQLYPILVVSFPFNSLVTLKPYERTDNIGIAHRSFSCGKIVGNNLIPKERGTFLLYYGFAFNYFSADNPPSTFSSFLERSGAWGSP